MRELKKNIEYTAIMFGIKYVLLINTELWTIYPLSCAKKEKRPASEPVGR